MAESALELLLRLIKYCDKDGDYVDKMGDMQKHMKNFFRFPKSKGTTWLGRSIILFVLSILCVCVVWWILLPLIDAQILRWVSQWIMPLNRGHLIIGSYIIVTISLGVYIYEHIKKKAHMSLKAGWVICVITILYSYYRFSPQSAFEFWHLDAQLVWADILYVALIVLILCEISYQVRMLIAERTAIQQAGDLLRDDAIAQKEEDQLEYGKKAVELATYLGAVDLSKRAFSVGVSGAWGIGKSSLLNLFAQLQEEKGQIVVRFEPRSAKRVDLIQEEFFSVLTHELSKYSSNANHLIGKYAYSLNLYSSTRWVYYILNLFMNWTSASEKVRINNMIQSIGKTIYVIIEDLDRLTGPEIIETLKLIDANGNFCNTVFLTAYDKKYVNSVLRNVIGYDNSLSDFTDKYFHFELPIFKQQNQTIYAFLWKHICAWAIDVCNEDAHQQRAIEKSWMSVYHKLSPYLTTIRQAKRYINLFRTTYRKCYENVNFSDFAVVTLIRFWDTQTYYNLYEKMYTTPSGKFSQDRTRYTLADGYKEVAKQSKVPNLVGLLESLFGGQTGMRQFESPYNRIYRVASFENYFYNTIKGRLYYGDMNEMMNAHSITEALGLFDKYIGVPNVTSAEQSIAEFLISRDAEWVMTKTRLTRYVCLLIYGMSKIRNGSIGSTLRDVMHVEGRDSYLTIMTEQEYKDCVMSAFAEMLAHSPYVIGQLMRERLNERYKHSEDVSQYVIDTLEEDQKLLNEAQKRYDAMYGKSEWTAARSLELASEMEPEDRLHASARAKRLKVMLQRHPDEYAKVMIVFSQPDTRKEATTAHLNYYGLLSSALGSNDDCNKWTRRIKDVNLRNIIQVAFESMQRGYGSIIRLGRYVDKPEQNLKLVSQSLKRIYEK